MPVTGPTDVAMTLDVIGDPPASSSPSPVDTLIKCAHCHDLLSLSPVSIAMGGSIGEVLSRGASNVLPEVEASENVTVRSGHASYRADNEATGLCSRCAQASNNGDHVGSPAGAMTHESLDMEVTSSEPSAGPHDERSISQDHTVNRQSQPVAIDHIVESQITSPTYSSPYPLFMPPSELPSGFISSIPSTSTAYTKILTPPETLSPDLHTQPEGGSSAESSKRAYGELLDSQGQPRTGSSKIPTRNDYTESIPNPLLDIGRCPRSSGGRGTLYPGSIFRGKQTSGRSSYEVEVRILDVDFASSTLSGYLSISHLTDTHPKLTTFFSGEIIGPTYGFLTGTKYYAQATEQDDLRHWSRFDRFHQVRGQLRRPGLTMNEMERVKPGGDLRERGYVFMRWKERFLVPDHKVRDISGASFAGFYYLQLELEDVRPPTPPTQRKSETVYMSGRPGPRSGPSFPRRESGSILGSPASTPPLPPTSPIRRAVRPEGMSSSILPTPPPGFAMRSSAARADASRYTEKESDLGIPVLKVN
jgi:hypothetical protein